MAAPTRYVHYSHILQRVHRLLYRARRSRLQEPTAMALATADARGRPTVRTVLLKDADDRGFVFYTNLESRKGRHLARNPRAALCWYWDPLREQVMVEGTVRIVSKAEADAYWATRPRQAQLGAWASRQSRTLDRRATLIARVARYTQRFAGRPIPRPSHWSGFRLIPDRVELWTARPFRLNDRLLYQRMGHRWKVSRLYP